MSGYFWEKEWSAEIYFFFFFFFFLREVEWQKASVLELVGLAEKKM